MSCHCVGAVRRLAHRDAACPGRIPVLSSTRPAFHGHLVSSLHPPARRPSLPAGAFSTGRRVGLPPIERQFSTLDPSPGGGPAPADGITAGYAPRRTILDKILLDAAVAAGVVVREHFSVEGLVTDGERVTGIRGRLQGGTLGQEEARIVIGADGLHSVVARMVGAPTYNEQPATELRLLHILERSVDPSCRAVPATGTHADRRPTTRVDYDDIYWPVTDFRQVRADIEGQFSADRWTWFQA